MGKDLVDLRTDEQNVHAEIEPEHADSDSGQAAVGAGKGTHVLNIVRKQKGEAQPSACGKQGTGQGVEKPDMLCRNHHVQ